jgi:hypothetical protein
MYRLDMSSCSVFNKLNLRYWYPLNIYWAVGALRMISKFVSSVCDLRSSRFGIRRRNFEKFSHLLCFVRRAYYHCHNEHNDFTLSTSNSLDYQVDVWLPEVYSKIY